MSTHAGIISQCIKYHHVQSTEQVTLERTSKRSTRWGWDTDRRVASHVITTSGLCSVKGISAVGATISPCCSYDDLRDYWRLVHEVGSQGCQTCTGKK